MSLDDVELVVGDITEVQAQAIVNAANTELILGSGVAGAIREKGGPSVQEQCDEISPIPLGEACVTTAGDLNADYIIHAASISSDTLTTEDSLRETIQNVLLRAQEKELKSLAIPAIGTGVARFPIACCGRVTKQELRKFFEETGSDMKITIVLYDQATLDAFKPAFDEN